MGKLANLCSYNFSIVYDNERSKRNADALRFSTDPLSENKDDYVVNYEATAFQYRYLLSIFSSRSSVLKKAILPLAANFLLNPSVMPTVCKSFLNIKGKILLLYQLLEFSPIMMGIPWSKCG